MRPLFIGEAPSRSTSRPGSAPLVGESGHWLAAWAGLSPAEFRRRAELVNLFSELPARWDHRTAHSNIVGVLAGQGARTVVLLGDKVRRAALGKACSLPSFVVTAVSG